MKKELWTLYHFINIRKEYKVESDNFNYKISAGKPVRNGGRTCNNLNKVKFSMENHHTLLTYFGIKLFEIGMDDLYSAKFR